MLEQTIVFSGCSSIQFLIYPPFTNTVSEATWDKLSVTVQHLCNLGDPMLPQWSSDFSHSALTQGSRGFPQWWQVSYACAPAHILSLLATKKYYLVGFLLIPFFPSALVKLDKSDLDIFNFSSYSVLKKKILKPQKNSW